LINKIILKTEKCHLKIKMKRYQQKKKVILLRDNFCKLRTIKKDIVKNMIIIRIMGTIKRSIINLKTLIKILVDLIIKNIIEIIKTTIDITT
jgi:hypothetical protein